MRCLGKNLNGIKCKKAFQESTKLIASDIVLVHYDMTLKVRCDASQVGIGSVLL